MSSVVRTLVLGGRAASTSTPAPSWAEPSSLARAMQTVVYVGFGFGGLVVIVGVGGALSETEPVSDIVVGVDEPDSEISAGS